MMVQEPGQNSGVYVMRVAAMLTGMHPQTLRKYERAGLIEPTRNKNLRMYSEKDIARLKTIKHLVEKVGLNIAGVKITLAILDTVEVIRRQLATCDLAHEKRKQLLQALDDGIGSLRVVLGGRMEGLAVDGAVAV
ncbi:MAG TPA: MerR family transcriptional regulator [Dehalococcoidales bacterium]|nr:MerR family transcriptional regulator [Dehalococcoidales bacterium]